MTPLAKLLEAALFASARPIPADELATLDPESSPAAVAAALDELREHYDVDGHGVELAELGGGWQILTRAEYTEAIERAQLAARPQRLSAAALETLAIIAYRQPIGRAEIEEIRGVAVGGVLKSLHERGLIDVTGRAEGMGRPLLYGTTPLFLEHFALRHLEELPRADELAIALRVQGKTPIDPTPVEEEPTPTRTNGRSGRSTKKARDAAAAPELAVTESGIIVDDAAVATADVEEVMHEVGDEVDESPEVEDATLLNAPADEADDDAEGDEGSSPDAGRPTPDGSSDAGRLTPDGSSDVGRPTPDGRSAPDPRPPTPDVQ